MSVSFLAECGEGLDVFVDRLVEAEHVLVLPKVPIVDPAALVLSDARQDVVLLLGLEVGFLAGDSFESGALWRLAALDEEFGLGFETPSRKLGVNSDAGRFDSVEKPLLAAIVGGPDADELEIRLSDDGSY